MSSFLLPFLLISSTSSVAALPEKLLNMVGHFPDYVVNINYDEMTEDVNSLILSNKRQLSIYQLNNDEKYIPINDNRSATSPHLHVFLLNDVSILNKSLGVAMSTRDVAIVYVKIHTPMTRLKNICNVDRLYRIGGVFILTVNSTVFNCCYYCNHVKTSLRQIGKSGDSTQLEEYINGFTDFHGYSFKIGFTEFLPFIHCSYNQNHSCKKYYGPEWEIIQALSKSFKFNYRMIEFNEKENKTAWQIMIQNIHDGQIDWAVSGITQTFGRSQVFDFTKYIKMERYMAIYKLHKDNWFNLSYALRSLYTSSWIAIIAIAGAAISLVMITKFSLKISSGADLNLSEYIMVTFMYVVEQHSPSLDRQISIFRPYIKVIFCLWITCTSCITTYYKSQLASFLMINPTDPSDAEDMIRRGFGFEIHRYDLDYLKFRCANSTNYACKKMLQAEVKMDICESVMATLNKKIAFLGDELPLQYVALRKCNLTLEQKDSLKIATAKAIGTEWHGWPLRKNTPFLTSFSRIISRLEATGLLKFWYQRELGNFRELKNSHQYLHETVLRPLNLYHFMLPFSILIIGNCISIVVYLVEMFYGKTHQS